MSPGVLGAESDTWSSSRSSLRCWDPPIPHAERGAHERPRLALSSVGLLQHAHARTLSLPALTGSPRRAAPLHRHPAKPRTRQTPPTLPDFALARIPAAHLARSIPIAGVRGDRRRAASFNAPFSRIALPRDDTKKPSSFEKALFILRHWPPRSPMPQRTLAASSRADRARLAAQHPMPAHRRRQPACG